MEEPSLGADNLGRVSSSSKLWPGPCWLHERDLGVWGARAAAPGAGSGAGEGRWELGNRRFLPLGGRNWEYPSSAGRGAMLSESGNDFQAANIPFQPQSCHKNLPCSCRQLALVAMVPGVSWTHWLPVGRGAGVLVLAHEDHLDIEHQKGAAPSCFIWAGSECSEPGMLPQSQCCCLLPPGSI